MTPRLNPVTPRPAWLGPARVRDADAWLRVSAVALVVSSVLLYGGASPAGQLVFQLGAAVIGIGLALRAALRRSLRAHSLSLALPLVLLAALALLQLVPLPPGLRGLLGAAPELSLRYPLTPRWLPLSLNPHATATALRSLVAVTIVFVAALATIGQRSAVSVATWLLAAAGVVAAASVWNFLSPGALFAVLPGLSADRLRGPFVNPDHFAAWLAALLPLGLAGLLARGDERGPWRAYRLASAISLPLLAAALGLTFSRGGMIAALCALLYFALRGNISTQRRVLAAASAIGAGLLLYAGWAGGSGLAGRLLQLWRDPLADLRVPIWLAAAHTVARAPIFGSGLGTFLEAARPVLGTAIPSHLFVDYAHSEPLQLAAEMGAFGLAIGAWGLFRWFRRVDRARRAAQPSAATLSLGAEAGMVALLTSALVDFAVRLPAVGGLGAVIAALALAAAGAKRRDYPLRAAGAVGSWLAIVALLAAAPGTVSSYLAAGSRVAATNPAADWSAAAAELRHDTTLDPGAGRHHYALGRLFGRAGFRAWTEGIGLDGQALGSEEDRAREAQALYVRAVNAYLDAIACDRTNPAYRGDLGWICTNLAALEETFAAVPFTPELLLDRLPRDAEPSDLAYGLYRDAVALEPRNADLQYALGDWALDHLQPSAGGGLGLATLDRQGLDVVAVRSLRRALLLDPSLLQRVVHDAVARGATYADLRQLVPDEPALMWQLALVLEDAGRSAWTDELIRALLQGPPPGAPGPLVGDLARAVAERRPPAAARPILAALAASKLDPAVLGELARVEERLGAYDDSERDFRLALRALPPSPRRNEMERDLGLLLVDRGNLAAAGRHFAAMLAERPHDPWALLGRGLVADRRDQWLDATRDYQRAKALAAEDDYVYYQLGLRYFDRGLYHQAQALWQSGLRLNPDNAQMRLWLARSYARTGRPEEALTEYRTVLRLRPGDAEADAELAALLAKEPG